MKMIVVSKCVKKPDLFKFLQVTQVKKVSEKYPDLWQLEFVKVFCVSGKTSGVQKTIEICLNLSVGFCNQIIKNQSIKLNFRLTMRAALNLL